MSSKREKVHAMDASNDPTSFELELEMFQKQVAEQFTALSSSMSNELLSLSWVRKLLDTFVCCQEQFRIILFNNRNCLGRPPMDRIIGEFYERSVKGLDVCNAIRDGVEQVRQWVKLLEIVVCALDSHRSIGEGHVRRAKTALIDLLIGMLDEKESNAALSHRNRSFGSHNSSSKDHKHLGHYRSLSWSISRSWSALKQLQGMANNLNPPKPNDVMATNGLAVVVYTMSCVLFLVMWVLVAAIPCQDRGLHTHISIPRQFIWAAPILSIYDKVLEESKKRERKNVCGLLKEVHQTEKWTRQMNEMLDSLKFPLCEEKEGEVRQKVDELKEVFGNMKEGLMPLERQVREVFHLIVRSRTEGLDSFGRNGNAE